MLLVTGTCEKLQEQPRERHYRLFLLHLHKILHNSGCSAHSQNVVMTGKQKTKLKIKTPSCALLSGKQDDKLDREAGLWGINKTLNLNLFTDCDSHQQLLVSQDVDVLTCSGFLRVRNGGGCSHGFLHRWRSKFVRV